jgi:hypothetical protein
MRRGLSSTFVIAATCLTVAASAAAQEAGPAAGTWGVEGTLGSASLLRFQSTESAWLAGLFASYLHRSTAESDGPTGPIVTDAEDRFSAQLRMGFRRYGPRAGGARSFWTLSGLVGYSSSSFQHGWAYGTAGELGAAYFFSSHVSLGGSGEVTVVRDDSRGIFGRSLTVNFGGFRLLGAVYF